MYSENVISVRYFKLDRDSGISEGFTQGDRCAEVAFIQRFHLPSFPSAIGLPMRAGADINEL